MTVTLNNRIAVVTTSSQEQLAVADATYTNATPTEAALGNIPEGATFSGKTMTQMWDSLLYAYATPAFGAFRINGVAGTLEVGATIAANPTFVWSTTIPANVAEKSIVIRDVTGSADLGTGLRDDSVQTLTRAALTKTVPGTHVFRITGTNTASVPATFTRDLTLPWYWRVFYGESEETSLDAEGIAGLRQGTLQSGFAGTYVFAGGDDYLYLCFPASLGSVTTFTNAQTEEAVAFEAPATVSVTNVNNITTNYKVYRSTATHATAINIVVA